MKQVIKSLAVCMLLTCSMAVQAQSEADMKKWMDYSTPSEIHKMLAQYDGEWKEEITFWMDPKAPAQKMQATCINKMILGDRYQESKHVGEFEGMPFEGIGMLAYDNVTKKFTSTWIDNMGTGMLCMTGAWDDATKSVVLTGTMTDPMAGKPVKVREVFTVLDANTQELTQYTEKDGKEFKNMYIKMTRK